MFDVKGARGEIKVGYRTIATFGRWELNTSNALTSDTVQADPFWSSMPGQRTVRVQVGTSWWSWSDCQVASLSPLYVTVGGHRQTEK